MKNTNWVEPEKITASHAWRRWAARILDNFLLGCISFSISYLLKDKIKIHVLVNDLSAYCRSMANTGGILYIFLILFVLKMTCYIILPFFGSFLSGVWNAALIACFGNTPGKQLFGIKVLHTEDRSINFQEACKREVLVWLKGLGLGIPMISLFTEYRGYKNLRKNKITAWDKQMNLKVSYRIQPLWITLAGVIILIVAYFSCGAVVKMLYINWFM